jgi:hypothetical protein
MIQECPHCLTHILPRKDGTCPSCGQDTTRSTAAGQADAGSQQDPIRHPYRGGQPESAAPQKSAITARANLPLPSFCAACGQHTEQRRAFVQKRIMDRSWLDFITVGISALLGVRILGGDLERNNFGLGRRKAFTVYLPICPNCKDEKIEPLSVNFETLSIRLAVHENLATACRSSNES